MREREGDAGREIKEEADGQGSRQADRDIEKDGLKQTERNAGKVQGFRKSMMGLKREQRKTGKCTIKEEKLGISAVEAGGVCVAHPQILLTGIPHQHSYLKCNYYQRAEEGRDLVAQRD